MHKVKVERNLWASELDLKHSEWRRELGEEKKPKTVFLLFFFWLYSTGDYWRNNSRKNEETEPKQKQSPVVNVTGDGSKTAML